MAQDKAKLIQALGIERASPEEQQDIMEKVDKRLQAVVVETLVKNLSENDAKKLREMLADPGATVEEEVAKMAAYVPSLAEKIERAVEEEIGRLRAVLAS